jgi:hypothetical protein
MLFNVSYGKAKNKIVSFPFTLRVLRGDDVRATEGGDTCTCCKCR